MDGSKSAAWCLLVLALVFAVDAQAPKLKLCVNEDQAGSINNCRNLNKTESLVNCVFVRDSVDCALKIMKGNATFGVFTGEEAVLASKFLMGDGLVTHELRQQEYFNKAFAFQAVAIVKSTHTGGLDGLRKKNFCHPGFSENQYWNDYVLKYFERSVIKPSNYKCDAKKTAIRNELDALTTFFNSSCRPGVWIDNEYYNQKLKRDYSQLCDMCDIKGEGCSYMGRRNQGDHVSTIRCVTQGQGDVAYVSLQSVQEYFKMPGNAATVNNFKFLCKDGSLQDINSATPCAWVQQPWSTVVTFKKANADYLKENLNKWLGEANRANWQEALKTVILEGTSIIVNVSDTNNAQTTVTDYVKRGREIPEEFTADVCDPIRWCILPNETTKCRWMKAAALTHGVSPEFQCIAGKDQWDCFKMIQNHQADFIGIDSSLGYIARHTYALSSQMFQDTVSDDYYQAITLINNKRASTAPIRSLRDLKGKKACFTEFGSIGWVSLVEALRKQDILRNACPYGKTLGNFFGQICAPGAYDPTHNQKGAAENINACSLCPRSCNATVENKFFGDVGAFECLTKQGGEVAFVNGKRIREIIESKNGNIEDFSVLCRNGTVQKLSAPIDSECQLISAVGGELIGRISRPTERSYDFYLALLNMEDWFGQFKHNNEHVFHMYGAFDGEDDLIFKSSTNNLINYYDQQLDEVKSYVELKERADKCGAAASAHGLLPSVPAILATIVMAIASTK